MGQVITFYSYKGGVGRTFAVANVAAQLSLWGYKVLVVDWDLEAPGLHHYFGSFMSPPLESGALCDRRGLVEYFEAWEKDPNTKWRDFVENVQLPGAISSLTLICACQQTLDYGPRASGIPWDMLYEQRALGAHLAAVADEWRKAYDFTFVDSRTGLADTAGICTVQLPDIVAFILTASHQSVAGTAYAAARIEKLRARWLHSRSLPYQVPIVSRFAENEEVDLAEKWRGIIAVGVDELFQAWCPPETTVRSLVEILKLPHIARWTYGDELPVLTELSPGDPLIANNTQLISYHIQTLSAVFAHRLSDVAALVRDRSGYVSRAAQRAVVRPGGASGSSEEVMELLSQLEKDALEASARGDLIAALTQYREIQGKAESAYGQGSPAALNAVLNIARTQQTLGDESDAEHTLREAWQSTEALGTADLDIAPVVRALAALLHAQGRLAEAESLYRRLLTMLDRGIGETPELMQARGRLASILQEQGKVLRVFCSATSADLRDVRQAVREFFNRPDQFKAVEQENLAASPSTLLESERDHLADCDAVLHIVGECYGDEPPAAEGSRRSYAQREYDYATEHGKPLYLFVCEESFPYTEHAPESEEKQALQRAHRAAVLKGDFRYERIANFADLHRQLGRIQLAALRLAAEFRPTLILASPLERYYQNLRERFANYDNVGLPVTAREGREEKEEPIRIRDLFVPPLCSAQHIRPAELETAVREGKTCGEPLLPLLEKPAARLILLSGPGTGKSTIVQYLIATLADGKAPAQAAKLRGAIPFPFILRELARLLPDDVKKWDWDALLDAFCRWDPRSGSEGPLAAPIANPATLRSLIGQEDAFFLVDGLDEIGDPAKRLAIRNAIWQGFAFSTSARWLVTSRIVGYERAELHDFTEGEWRDPHLGRVLIPLGGASNRELATLRYLAPFNDIQQLAFAQHWYIPRMGAAKGAQRAKEFIAAVHQHPHTLVIGRIPNLLYLLALLYRHQAQLPNGRGLVYEAISEAYLESIPLQRLLLGEVPAAYTQSFAAKEQLLAIVGMKMQQMRASRREGEDGDILVSREQLGEWLAGRFDSEAALQEFLDHVARHSGLLLPYGDGVYGFADLSFQEYYAACFLRSDFERIVAAKARPAGGFLRRSDAATDRHEERIFSDYAAQPAWREPLLFLVEKFGDSRDYTAQLLEWMFQQLADDPAKGKDWMPFSAAQLLAIISIDPEVALDMQQREALWRALWQADSVPGSWEFRIAPSLLVPGSAFHFGVLQSAAAVAPHQLCLSGCPALYDLSPLAGLTGLQRLDLGGCTGLGDLTPLAGLTGLQRLYLGGCTGLGDLTPLAGLTGLQWLNLSGCPGLGDLTPLAGLTGLQRLDLMHCTGLGDLTPLAGLTGLQWLDLSSCTALGDLAPLAGLTGLKSLLLLRCSGLSREQIDKLQKALPQTQISF